MNDDDFWLTGPTGYAPGSPGKLAVMRERAARRLPLFDKDDYTLHDCMPATAHGHDGEDD